jgi:hypothetical protein
LIKVLAAGGDSRLGRGQHYFAERVRAAAGTEQPSVQQIMAAVWSLLGQGLAYLDYSQPAPENWRLELTEAGLAAARDRHPNPDDPAGYLARLKETRGISPVVEAYATEALLAYNARLYRSSVVMIGVASEALVFEAGDALAALLNESERKHYLEQLRSLRLSTIAKFAIIQQKMRSHIDDLPAELADGLDLTINSVTDFLRTSRNAAGHPTGAKMDREDGFTLLQMFIRYASRLYSLKS